MKTHMTSEQQMQLTMLFAQQDLLNQIILDYNKHLNEKKEKFNNPSLETVIELLKSVVDNINIKQRTIDTQINQIQNDIRARLN